MQEARRIRTQRTSYSCLSYEAFIYNNKGCIDDHLRLVEGQER